MAAGSSGGYTKRIVGLESVISDLETLFDGGKIWPRLATREDEPAPPSFYRYKPISPTDDYLRVAPGLSARVMPVSHGNCEQADGGVYESSAYFVRNDRTAREFLFFGDVEPDSISKLPQTRAVWRVAARKILASQLDTIFLECSWRSDRGVDQLYGHLTPVYVLEELRALASEVVAARTRPRTRATTSSSSLSLPKLNRKHSAVHPHPPTQLSLSNKELEGVLDGIRLVVIHCKDSTEPLPAGMSIHDVILHEIRGLLDEARLGISVTVAAQGTRIGKSSSPYNNCMTLNVVPHIQRYNLTCPVHTPDFGIFLLVVIICASFPRLHSIATTHVM